MDATLVPVLEAEDAHKISQDCAVPTGRIDHARRDTASVVWRRCAQRAQSVMPSPTGSGSSVVAGAHWVKLRWR